MIAGRAERGRVRRAAGAVLAVLAAAVGGGCELSEVVLAKPEDGVIADVQVVLAAALDDPDRVEMSVPALLHRLYGTGSRQVRGAEIRIMGASGKTVYLEEAELEECAVTLDPDLSEEWINEAIGSCYVAPAGAVPFAPGEALSLRVTTRRGEVLTGTSQVPDTFRLLDLAHADGRCRLEPDTNYRLRWTPSDGTWTYLAETEITGLQAAFEGSEINAPDTLSLLGLSIGRDDNDIVFPKEFGLFEIFDDKRDLIRALQDGLPEGTAADVSITAIDRNWTNWERGGDPNPSGEVRISSVFGDGGGVFGTGVQHKVRFVAMAEADGQPPSCGPPEP